MKAIKFFRIGYLMQAFFFWLFFYFSIGLFFFDENTQSYQNVKSLYSSGSDDDIAIWVLAFFDFVIFLLLLRKGSLKYVSGLMVLSVVLTCFSLALIQVGSIITTILVKGSIFLLLGFLIKLLVFAYWLVILVNSKDINKTK